MVNTERRDECATPTRTRRRLSVDDRRAELMRACLDLIGTHPWDEVSMADIAAAAGVSKPLLYHYFSTKPDLYLATVRSAADELRAATRLDPDLAPELRTRAALDAYLEWAEQHATAYRAVIQGGISSDANVQAIVERTRAEVVDRLAESFGWTSVSPTANIALHGWVGFLEAACLVWLESRPISKAELAELLTDSAAALFLTLDRGSPAR